ncbi:MAG: TolC family protein, partial [Planctomycetaceae bacterium]
EAGLESAVQSRPELMAQRIRVRQSQLELEHAKDGLLPNVVASANYALTGLGDGVTRSFDQLASVGYGNWGLGVSYRMPIGRRAARSLVQRAEIAHRRNQQTLAESQRGIEFEVQQIHQTIQHAFEVMERQNQRLTAATQQFQTSRRMYETGQMDLDRYVRAQQSLVVAKREQRESIIEYNLAISKWYFLTNTLTLSESNVGPADKPVEAKSIKR